MAFGRPQSTPLPGLTRVRVLAAVPVQLPTVSRTELDGGELRVRVRVESARWQRWIGAGHQMERDFVLDRLGREVYDACDGKTDVRSIAAAFAVAHQVSLAEGELSVSAYLKTLTTKGLAAIALPREAGEATPDAQTEERPGTPISRLAIHAGPDTPTEERL